MKGAILRGSGPAPVLHLAWGPQPACGKVGLPITADATRVTCPFCLNIARRERFL